MQILVENQKTIGYYPLDLRDKIRLMVGLIIKNLMCPKNGGQYKILLVKYAVSPINNL